MDDMTITTPHLNLDAFRWLKPEQWTASTLLTDPVRDVGGRRHCKVCDAWVNPGEADKHASHHRRERVALTKLRANAADREKKRLAALSRRENAKVAA